MPICQKLHRHFPGFELLPVDQGGVGRHKCCGCAYEHGYAQGLARAEVLYMELDSLPESQAGTVRHKSPHAAFAMGYKDGVAASYS